MASNTAAAVLQIVGTVVGAYFGYPYLGSLIGTLAGNLVSETPEGPRLGDLNVRASTYGKNIPLIYGRENRVGGNIIWSKGITEHEDTSGSKILGSQVKTYTYTASFALALGQGVMRNIYAIYANGKLLWTRQGALDRLKSYQAQQQLFRDLCSIYGDPAKCQQYIDSLDYLENVDKAKELPDFTPWILRQSVSLSSEGTGEYQDRAATMYMNGPFTQLEWFPGTPDQPLSLIIPAPTPAYRNTAYLVIRDLELARFGNQIPTIEVITGGLRQETVADVIGDICRRAGSDIDEVVARGALTEFFVRGYAIGNARSAISAIQPLMIAYPFDACDQDGTMRFVPRGRSPVCTIPEEDMGARQADEQRKAVFPIERIPNYELPSEASITYVDPANAYQAGTQIAARSEGDAETKLNQTLAITFTAAEAMAIAERLLYEGWLSREQVKPICVSTKYDFLQAGDLFAAKVPGGYGSYRIIEKTRGDNGIIELGVIREDRTAYDGDSAGSDPFNDGQEEPFYDYIIPYLFNAPIMAPDEDNSGFSYALDSPGKDLPVAKLYRSTDETATWQFAARSTSKDRIAYLTDVLEAGPTDIWDRENTISIAMLSAKARAPEPVDEETLLSNPRTNLLWVGSANGFTGELIQYATVVEQSDGRYLLSNLLRGRRATEYAVVAHGTDETAVFIPDESTGSLDYGVGDWNLDRFYTALAANQTLEDGTMLFKFASTGERLRPRAPTLPSGSRDGSNNLTIDWVRRTRLFAPPMGYGPAPLGEADERYEVDIIVGSDVVRTLSSASGPEVSYSAANQTTDGITPGNPVTGKIYQISATAGRGHAADFTV